MSPLELILSEMSEKSSVRRRWHGNPPLRRRLRRFLFPKPLFLAAAASAF